MIQRTRGGGKGKSLIDMQMTVPRENSLNKGPGDETGRRATRLHVEVRYANDDLEGKSSERRWAIDDTEGKIPKRQRRSGTCRPVATKAVDKNGPTDRNESIFDLQMTISRENSLNDNILPTFLWNLPFHCHEEGRQKWAN